MHTLTEHDDLTVQVFVGNAAKNSYFTKADFSPDGTHIISGTIDSQAYIWQARRTLKPALRKIIHDSPLLPCFLRPSFSL